MRVYLDEAACDVQATSVAAAVNAAAAVARRRGRTIVDILVDGRPWSADQLDRAETDDASPAHEVRLASANPRDLVCQAFSDAAGTLTEIDHLQQTAAELLQSDRAAEAMERLGRAIDLWGSVQQALTMGAEMIELDLSPQRPVIEQLTANLRSLRGALEQRDSVALADTLLYDLPEAINQWRALLHTLRERVRQGGAKA